MHFQSITFRSLFFDRSIVDDRVIIDVARDGAQDARNDRLNEPMNDANENNGPANENDQPEPPQENGI